MLPKVFRFGYYVFVIAITLNLFCYTYAQSLPQDIKDVSKYIDTATLPSDYSVYSSSTGENGIKQIVFLNRKMQQRISFTFDRGITSMSGKKLQDFFNDTIKNDRFGAPPPFTQKRISCGEFEAQNQKIPYCLFDQYDSGKLMSKAMGGVIPNVNGKAIIIQSFAHPERYNEAVAEDFFRKVRFKTEAF